MCLNVFDNDKNYNNKKIVDDRSINLNLVTFHLKL